MITNLEWEALREQNNRLEIARAELAAYIAESLAWCDENIARIKASA
jgi:hypothetical protein